MPNRIMQPPVLKGTIQVMGEKFAQNLQIMSDLSESGNKNAANNAHEKPAKTFSEFWGNSYELILQLDDNQHEEYIGKITDTLTRETSLMIKNIKSELRFAREHQSKPENTRQQRDKRSSQLDRG